MTWEIGPGSEVTLFFQIVLEDGTVAEATEPGEPMHFTMNDGTLIRGLELALYGLRPGDKQTIKIPPQEGYGFPDPANKRVLKRDAFPGDMTLEEGMIMAFDAGGEDVPAVIESITGDDVLVDFNHPLAGHEIEFSVEIVDVGPPIGFKEE